MILSGANDFKDKPLVVNTKEFNTALHMVGELHEPTVEFDTGIENKWDSFFGRLSSWQFPLQVDRKTIIGRAYQLFILIPNLVNLQYNLNAKMKEFYGLDCFEFMASGFALWVTSRGSVDENMEIDNDNIKSIISKINVRKFIELSTDTRQNYCINVRGNDWQVLDKKKDLFALDPFLKSPFIQVVNSVRLNRGSFIVPQAKYLLDRASTGIFYLLADAEQKIAQNEQIFHKNPFRKAFGEIYREYVGMQFSQANDSILVIDLDKTFPAENSKKPDFAIIKGEICLLFEVKTSILTIESRTYFDENALLSQVKGSNITKAIKQLNSFKTKILNGELNDSRFSNIKTVINILVGYEDIFVLNSTLLPLLKQELGEDAHLLQLATISDIDSIGNCLYQNIDITEIIKDKINNETNDWSIAATLSKHNIDSQNKIVSDSFDAFLQKLGI